MRRLLPEPRMVSVCFHSSEPGATPGQRLTTVGVAAAVLLLVPGPPFARRSSFPYLKGAKERVGVFKAQQEGGFVQFHFALFEIMTGKFAARIFDELLKRYTSVR